jgi:flagellum-specific peptidoglycan hydrolase FlgJ
MSREEFIGLVAPIAVKLRLEGSPIFPSVRIAQAILETGARTNPWNNLTGYKVGNRTPSPYWSGRFISATTWEVVDGARVDNIRDDFRAYDTIEYGFKDQDLLFQFPRYTGVRQATTPQEQARKLLAGGYATDPAYADKLIQIMQSEVLFQYDEEVKRMLEQFRAELEALQKQVEELQNQASLPKVPDWAQSAVKASVAAGIIDTPEGGSYDFYRVLTLLHRKGIFK